MIPRGGHAMRAEDVEQLGAGRGAGGGFVCDGSIADGQLSRAKRESASSITVERLQSESHSQAGGRVAMTSTGGEHEADSFRG